METNYDIKRVKRTKITSVEEVNPGDVLLVYRVKGKEKNPKLPACNFRSVCVVTSKRQLDNGEWVYDHRNPSNLMSTNGDHKIIEACLSYDAPLESRLNPSSFGCNSRIGGGHIVFRLDTISSTIPTFRPVNLKGNPAYDLMM